MTIRLLVAEDHALMRSSLKLFFSRTSGIDVADEATSGAQALALLAQNRYDMLLLDMNIPDSGVGTISRAREIRPEVPVLVLSADDSPQAARQALKAGAVGYLTRNSAPETLLDAVWKIAAGGKSLDPALAQRMAFEEVAPATRQPHEKLSERELQILKMLADGHGVIEIANLLFISHKTVSTHKARLMEKMGFHSNAELVKYAIAQKLVD